MLFSQARSQFNRMIPLIHIKRKKTKVSQLSSELEKIAVEINRVKLPNGFSQFLHYVFAELFANISEHSFAVKADVNLSIKDHHNFIEISDSGIGLKKSYIRKKIFPKDDFAAVDFALNGLSTKNFKERGFGLYSIRKLVAALNRKMTLHSGNAQVSIQKKKVVQQTTRKIKRGLSIIIDTRVKKIDFYKFIG